MTQNKTETKDSDSIEAEEAWAAALAEKYLPDGGRSVKDGSIFDNDRPEEVPLGMLEDSAIVEFDGEAYLFKEALTGSETDPDVAVLQPLEVTADE